VRERGCNLTGRVLTTSLPSADVFASWPSDAPDAVEGRREIVVKLLSSDPSNYEDAPVEGVRRVLEIATGESFPRGVPIDPRKLGTCRGSPATSSHSRPGR
jgi:5-oxoprolinase (ATP-hydrolysing)